MRAALDVFENEPSVHSRLRSNPHVVSDSEGDSDGNSDAVWYPVRCSTLRGIQTLSPHSAAAPDSMSKGMNREVIRNVIQFLKTGVPNTPVNALQLKEAAHAAHAGLATKTKPKVVNGHGHA